MEKIILLTGATGFIGTALLDALVAQYPLTQIRCLVRQQSVSKIKCTHQRVRVACGNLLNSDFVDTQMEGVSVVIHLAALLRSESPQEVMHFNTTSTQLLVRASKKHQVQHFIYVSTENVMREDIQDAYAEGKREAEKIALQFSNTLILRPSFVFGEGDSHGLGKICSFAKRHMVVPQFGGLRAQVQPMYIRDMVAYLIEAMQIELTGTHIITGSEKITLNAFVKLFCQSRKLKRIFVPLPKFFWKALGLFADRFLTHAGWGLNQYRNIYYGRHYAPNTVFKHKPLSLKDAMQDWSIR